ncbi:23S rRNA (pseudouridine(1915)-N(3))-methyltransferase RlmH [Persicimonas caeni]|uniref:Ribosomal RNA large subunit methyltransferase H n=1 Tax=Persicimonas caeni TaxID=2292766 RepID=A0A4Y6Q0W8_PERCE|nr:23S rRNA (pseudouridine(1915)-N(3))-methyltransferase RlmH [Persicimonas caeni]QDG54226.1 23S rRNA (pseudouridine(1915)-N(3))-methyltransferase RlmH [Persicimonas caeni]QED35447.1 23S rRNA (pseudouridine(1915)-N(3))-methyltransferase RlmH [Persicimonas caeni]
MKFEIVAVGKLRNQHFRALTDDYLGRLEHYTPVEELEVRESRLTDRNVSKGLAEEAESLENAASEGAVTIALDERGKHLTSRELARWVDDWMVTGTRYVSFFIGSANGLDANFRKSCRRRLSLSKMTLPHEMARMMLAEQLYRAMSIIRGEPYHR